MHQLGKGGVAAGGGVAPSGSGEGGEAHFYLLVVVGFVDVVDFEAREAVVVVVVEAPAVEQQLYVARGVDVAVEVDVAVGEAVGDALVFGERAQARELRAAALHPLGEEAGDPLHVADVGGLAADGVEHGPDGARPSYGVAGAVEDLEIALGEEAVDPRHPCAHGVMVVDAGIALHLEPHAREHPCAMGGREVVVAYPHLVGVEGGHLYEAVDEQGHWHAPLRVALGGGEEICAFENLFHTAISVWWCFGSKAVQI